MPNYLPLFLTKSCYWNLSFLICNNFSGQNCLDKICFTDVIDWTILLQWTILSQRKSNISLFIHFRSTLIYYYYQNIYVYKYKHDYVYKGLLQSPCLITVNIWLNILLKISSYLDQNLVPQLRLVFLFISRCTHFRLLPTYNKVTLN